MTVAIPFDDVQLDGAEPLSVDLVWFDEERGEWVLAVDANTQPSPGHEPYMVGDRLAESGAVTPDLGALSDDLGDYGVFWNTASSQGFVWANVDHATDFAAGIRLCSSVNAPELEPVAAVNKNRYLSLMPGNPGVQTALRVTFVDLPAPYDVLNGQMRWVGPPTEISESAGNTGSTPAPTFEGSTLDDDPYYVDWSNVGIVQVYDDAIVPGGMYEAQAVSEACEAGAEEYYSDALEAVTAEWGDVVGNCSETPCTPSDGDCDFDDIASIVDKFKNEPGAPAKARADLVPATPDRIIDFSDISSVVDAFKGLPFPYGPT
jgi:hypothetical protein